jgi:hypothetical protein
VHPQNTPGVKANLTPGEFMTVPKVPPPPTNPPQTSATGYDPTPRWKKRLEIAAFCVLLVYTVFTVLMYFANKKAANAAQSAANTADATLKSSQSAFRQEQRPYLWAEPRGGLISKDNKPMICEHSSNRGFYACSIAIDIKNSGHSPAVNVLATASKNMWGVDNIVDEKVRKYVPSYPHQGQGQFLVVGGGMTPEGATLEVEDRVFNALIDGTWRLYVVGGVQYTDTFQPAIKPYETTYCFVVNPQGMPFANCNFEPSEFGNFIK